MYELRLLVLQHTRKNTWLAENKASSLQPCVLLNFCQASPEKAQETKRHCDNPDGFKTLLITLLLSLRFYTFKP